MPGDDVTGSYYSPRQQTTTHNSNIIKNTTITETGTNYEVAVEKAVTWYGEIVCENELINSEPVTENKEYSSSGSSYAKSATRGTIEYKEDETYTEDDFWDAVYNYIYDNHVTDYSYKYSTTMHINEQSVKTNSSTISSTPEVRRRLITKKENDLFVKLLRDDNGKAIKYKDLYSGETAVGDMLINGSEMLYTLLESTPNTQDLVNIMKYILYKYSGNNYGVTTFEFDIIDTTGFYTIGGNSQGNINEGQGSTDLNTRQ